MVTCTNRQVLELLQAVMAVQAAKANGLFKLKLGRTAATLRKEAQVIQTVLTELESDHTVKVDGKPVWRTFNGKALEGQPQWIDDTAFVAAQKAVLDATVELELPTFTDTEFKDLEFEGSIEGLLLLVKG